MSSIPRLNELRQAGHASCVACIDPELKLDFALAGPGQHDGGGFSLGVGRPGGRPPYHFNCKHKARHLVIFVVVTAESRVKSLRSIWSARVRARRDVRRLPVSR